LTLKNTKKTKREKSRETSRETNRSATLFNRLRGSATLTYGLLALLGIATGLVSLLLGASVYGLPMFRSYFASLPTVLLNLAPPVLFALLFYYVSGRAWISFTLTGFLVIASSLVNFFKVQVRSDPFRFTDFSIALEAGAVVGGYTLTYNWKVYVALAFFAVGIVLSALFLRHRQKRVLTRIIGSIATIAVCVVLYVAAYASTAVYANVVGDYDFGVEGYGETTTFNQAYIAHGFLYPFLHSVREAFPQKPENYNRARAEEVLGGYDYDAIPAKSRVNVISIMLEAYTDLSEFEGDRLNFNIDVYERFHALQAESLHGHLIDNIFGGGTIDTERLFLTGYLTLEPYHSATPSYVNYFKDNGYYAEGFHAGNNWYYDRADVHRYLGFDNYYFLEDFEKATRADDYFFAKLREMYDARDKSVPYFSHSLTYQNHGGYYDDWTVDTHYIERDGLADTTFNVVNNYLSGIYDTTQRVWDFVDDLRDDPEPVIVVIYGDHMPWLGGFGGATDAYADLGIDVSSNPDGGFYNMYQTPYVIWANDAAKAALGSDFTGDGGSFSPCFLMNRIFAACGWGGDEYMKAANALMAYTDVVNTPTGYFRENGILTKTLSPVGRSVYEDFKMAEYYRRFGKTNKR
jgi:hypothetical protein